MNFCYVAFIIAYFEVVCCWGPSWGKQLPEERPREPPRRDTRALSPAGMAEGKAPLRLAAKKSRPHAPLSPMRGAPLTSLANQADELD
jgi:hypothetical protein